MKNPKITLTKDGNPESGDDNPVQEKADTKIHKSERDWVEDFTHENGNYLNTCCLCHLYFYGHKRRVVCKVCDLKAAPESTPVIPEGQSNERANVYVVYRDGTNTTVYKNGEILKPGSIPIVDATGIKLTEFPTPVIEHKEDKTYYWLNELPSKPGKYIIRTKSQMDNENHLEAVFNGKTFDISNQQFVAYLAESKLLTLKKHFYKLTTDKEKGQEENCICPECRLPSGKAKLPINAIGLFHPDCWIKFKSRVYTNKPL